MTDKPVCSYCGYSNRVARFKGGDLLCIKHYLQMYNHGKLFEGHKSKNTNKFLVDGDVGKIITAKGEEILVDADTLPMLKTHSWCTLVSGGYAVANISGKVMRMHRLITEA